MNEYIKQMLQQIRCKKAHLMIEQEIRGHIEEQIEENLKYGMTQEEAEKLAVRDMGDPIENGILLDKIHKPQKAWDVILLAAIVSGIGQLCAAWNCNERISV